jgi:hypothetical protein
MSVAGIPYTVVIPIGPATEEIERARDLLRALRVHAAGAAPKVVLVDDAAHERGLKSLWPGATVVRTSVWGTKPPDPLTAHTAGTIEAMKHAEGAFALKLDTDALVIAPFERQLREAFASDPSLGVVGAFDRSSTGGRRDWSRWPGIIRRTTWPLRLVPRPKRGVVLVSHADRARARATIEAASRNPAYSLGAHCLGGAYAVSAALLAHASDWVVGPWVAAHLGEDIVLGLLCGAAGLRMGNLVAPGEAFGVTWKDLPAAPAELVDRGYSIVHSVKDGRYGTEAELRAWFRSRIDPASDK